MTHSSVDFRGHFRENGSGIIRCPHRVGDRVTVFLNPATPVLFIFRGHFACQPLHPQQKIGTQGMNIGATRH